MNFLCLATVNAMQALQQCFVSSDLAAAIWVVKRRGLGVYGTTLDQSVNRRMFIIISPCCFVAHGSSGDEGDLLPGRLEG